MDLANGLSSLRTALDGVRYPLELPQAAALRNGVRHIIAQLDDYLLPRLANLDAPLLAVVGGSTGAGKSTLVNTLIGRVVSRPGVIRPTTKAPVLVHNPNDERWFSDDRVLPGLIRSKISSDDQRSLQVVSEPSLPRGLAILDAPDVDSVDEINRMLGAQLLDAADMWLFVTSAARYADAVPWEFLSIAARRGASVAVVVDRVPPSAMRIVPADLGRLMTDRGLAEAPLFAVPETVVDDQGLLPDQAVAPIRSYLASLAADTRARDAVVRRTLDGAIDSLIGQIPPLIAGLEAQQATCRSLSDDASASFQEAARAVSVASSDGTLLRGEVLSRWHDYVGTNDLMRGLDQKVSILRDRLVGMLTNRPKQADDLTLAAGSGLEALIREQGEAAAERAALAWRGNPAGRQIMAGRADLSRVSPDFPIAVGRAIRSWQSDVLALVSEESGDKRKSARLAALGVNGVGAALMLFIFFNTGGITGAEGGVAVGTTVVAQRLLESIFGDEAVRRLATRAKENLDARVEGLMAGELTRYLDALGEVTVSDEAVEKMRNALADVRRSRENHPRVPVRGPVTGDMVELEPGDLRAIEPPGASETIVDAEVISEYEARQ